MKLFLMIVLIVSIILVCFCSVGAAPIKPEDKEYYIKRNELKKRENEIAFCSFLVALFGCVALFSFGALMVCGW